MRIVVGQGSCGIAAGASKVYDALEKLIPTSNDELTFTGCIGMCFLEPIVDIYDGKSLVKRLVRVQPSDAEKIIAFTNGDENAVKDIEISDDDKSFLEKQTRIALRHCGLINPEKIEEYIADDGYSALKKVLFTMSPEDVIEEIKTSGLAGRDYLFNIVDYVNNNDVSEVMNCVYKLHSEACDMERLCTELINHYRNLMIIKTAKNPQELIICTEQDLQLYKTQSENMNLQKILSNISALETALGYIKHRPPFVGVPTLTNRVIFSKKEKVFMII